MKTTKKALFAFAIAAASSVSMNGQTLPQLGQDPIEDVIAAMTNEEKAHFLIGTGMAGFTGDWAVVGETQTLVPGAAGTTYPIERLGIPGIVLADGPAGLRISPTREGDPNTYYCTGFPVASSLAATWNTELVEQVGAAMGNEVKEYGADVLLAPALNIHRNPLNGRNFEYYSEDPFVSGKMAAAMVKGVQSNGVGVSLKHFVANNQESNRRYNDVRVSHRALREIYLKGFEIAVKETDPWTVMSSYNHVNGVYTSENYDLLTTILRDEWGFNGIVMTDWFGGNDVSKMVAAGNDLIQPGLPQQYEALYAAIESGSLPQDVVNLSVKRMLELVMRSPRFKGYAFSNQPDLKAHAQITRKSAAESMVLLKNDQDALPFAPTVQHVAAFGITSYDFIAGGTGSGDVNKAYTVSLLEGLANAGLSVDSKLTAFYAKYRKKADAAMPAPQGPLAMFMPKRRPDEYVPTGKLLARAVKNNDVAVITLGRTSGEFSDRELDRDFYLSENEKALIKNVSEAFAAAGKHTVVILNTGGVIETASWKNDPSAILLAGQAGQEGGNTVADALTGKSNPSGKLTSTYPITFEDHWSSKNFPMPEERPEPTSGLNATYEGVKNEIRNIDYTVYEEGIYVGYRYFDSYNIPTSYPFGYGLSYTNFEYSNAQMEETESGYSITVQVTNTGKVAGKEVVQVYVAAPDSEYADKPAKELKAFAKTKLLEAGESEVVRLEFSRADLASFNELELSWIVDAGEYKTLVGTSSTNILFELPFEVSETVFVEKAHHAF